MADPTYLGPHRPVALRVLNSLARGGRLHAEQLVGAARRRTGLQGMGPPAVLEPLGLLVDSLERDAALSPLGA